MTKTRHVTEMAKTRQMTDHANDRSRRGGEEWRSKKSRRGQHENNDKTENTTIVGIGI